MMNRASGKQHTKAFWWRHPWAIWWLFIGLVVGGCALVRILYPMLWYNPDLISEPVSMQIFSQTTENHSETAVTPQTQDRLCIWIETSPSMAGFLSDEKSNAKDNDYPKTFFEQLVLEPDMILGEESSSTKIERYTFNPAFAQRVRTSGSADASSLRESQRVTNVDTILNEDFFFSELETNAHALSAVFEVLDTSCPNIIITDFLESGSTFAYLETIRASFQSAFENERTVDIIGMEDAFGGFLFEVGGANEIISFGAGRKAGYSIRNDVTMYSSNQVTVTSTTRIDFNKSYINNPRPRPLYVIVVGTSAQCDKLSGVIMKLYDQYRESINSRRDLSLRPKPKDEETLPAARKFSLQRSGLLDVLRMVSDKATDDVIVPEPHTVAGDGKFERSVKEFDYELQPLHSAGVDAYRFKKDSLKTIQTYALTYSFKPKVENYEENSEAGFYSVGRWTLRRLAFSDEALFGSLSPQVHTLGDRSLYYYVAPADAGSAVQISAFRQTQDGIELEVTIDVSAMDKGYYRMDIPVQLRRSIANLENLLNRAPISVWNSENSVSFNDAVFSTPNLRLQLQALCEAQQEWLNQEICVAEISIDFEITEE